MPKIETEEQFLDLAEKSKRLLSVTSIYTIYDLSDDLYKEVYALYKLTQQIYNYISDRQIGSIILAALSYHVE
jgi:hypothetical protein